MIRGLLLGISAHTVAHTLSLPNVFPRFRRELPDAAIASSFGRANSADKRPSRLLNEYMGLNLYREFKSLSPPVFSFSLYKEVGSHFQEMISGLFSV